MSSESPSPPVSGGAVSGAAMDRAVIRRPIPVWRKPWAIAAAAGAILLLILLVWLPSSGSTDVAAADLETGQVTRAPFEDYLPVRATVEPNLTTFVSAVSGGQVEKLLVQEGAVVGAGQPLATLANPELKLDIATREADVAGRLGDLSAADLALERNRLDQASQLAAANYDLIKARRLLADRQQLLRLGILSEAGVKSYADEVAYQEQRLAQLRAGVANEARIANAQAARLTDARARLASNIEAVRAGLDALVVRAPVPGRLTNFTIQPGQMLKAGDQVGQVDSIGSWKLVAEVDEFYLGKVAVGQHATAEAGAKLVVSKVLPAVVNGHFNVELTFVGAAPPNLNRGQTMDIRVTLGATHVSTVAPVGGWLDAGGGTSAYVVDAGGNHARRRSIRVGSRNPEQVEILSGLEPGDRIVTSNTSAFSKSDVINLH